MTLPGSPVCGQFRENLLHQLRLQLGKLALENLRDDALDNLLYLLAVRHAQRTVHKNR